MADCKKVSKHWTLHGSMKQTKIMYNAFKKLVYFSAITTIVFKHHTTTFKPVYNVSDCLMLQIILNSTLMLHCQLNQEKTSFKKMFFFRVKKYFPLIRFQFKYCSRRIFYFISVQFKNTFIDLSHTQMHIQKNNKKKMYYFLKCLNV